ncbi:MAG: pyridoxamine 5'-phosphate oxidase family protein [Actinomycetota bacterium]
MNTTTNSNTELSIPNGTTDADRAVADDARQRERIRRALGRASFGMLATSSPAGFPHAAGVALDGVADDERVCIYVHMMRTSRKARNIAADGRVAMTVPVRKLPIGPPFTIQFQGRAELVDMDSSEIAVLLERGELDHISGHGALDEPDGVFARVVPTGRVHTYGIGVSALALARDPLHVGARSIERL